MMAWGVEARVPFLDREFLEYAMTLDPAVKMSGNRIEKYTLRLVLNKCLSERKKHLNPDHDQPP